MEKVLSDRDLLNLIFWQIEDECPLHTARLLTRWCAVNHTVRNASEDESAEVWRALMERGFKEWLEWNSGALAISCAIHGLHPRTYVKHFYAMKVRLATTLGQPGKPALSEPLTPYRLFLFFVRDAYLLDRTHDLNHHQSLYNWAVEKWNALDDWERVAFSSCSGLARSMALVRTTDCTKRASSV